MRFSSKAFAAAAALFLITMLTFAAVRLPQKAQAAPAHGGPILQQDFNAKSTWPAFSATALPRAITVSAALKPVGTIDTAGSTTPSRAILMTVQKSGAKGGAWKAMMSSGLLPVRNTETNLGKLTLSFDHSVSSVRPVTVRIESFSASKKRTGGLESTVYPAAPDFFLRAAVDLSTMHAFGTGTFRPTDPFVRVTFGVSSLPGSTVEAHTDLRIDNVSYASPAFYVSPTGNDSNDGRTEKTALADPQKAVEAAKPGDIILLMDGTFHRAPTSSIHEGIIAFHHGGTPAAWIVVKNYPGQHPVLTSDAWNTINIGRKNDPPPNSPTLVYLEVRKLHIRGIGDTIRTTHPELIGKADPLTNCNGIGASGGHKAVTPHHLRFADNLIEYCCGGGIGTGDCDRLTIENNIIRNNCWTTIYADSGISTGARKHFDAADNVYKTLIRNNTVVVIDAMRNGNRPKDSLTATASLSTQTMFQQKTRLILAVHLSRTTCRLITAGRASTFFGATAWTSSTTRLIWTARRRNCAGAKSSYNSATIST